MALSFQERYRRAKAEAKAEAKGKPAKIKSVKPLKAKTFRVSVKENTLEQKARQIAIARQAQRSVPSRDKVFQTLPLNLADKIQVRIDHKTIVYVLPGTDIEKIKEKYLKKPKPKNDDGLPPVYQF